MTLFTPFRNVFRKQLLGGMSVFLVSASGTAIGNESPASPPLPAINVATVLSERITEWDEYTGRLQAPETVVLKPRVSGYVTEVAYREGDLVHQGDVLFSIDDRLFRAEVERLEAQQASLQSQLKLAESEFVRAKRLNATKAISADVYDNRQAALQQARAELDALKASLKHARLQLSFTKVVSPIDGRVSHAQVTQGNYVTSGQSELTTIVSTEQMYAWFDVDEQTYLNYVRNHLVRVSETRDSSPVMMALSGDAGFSYQGHIDFINNSVNQQTGSIRMRATFENKAQMLMPGLFARLRLIASKPYDAILIDEKAVGTDLNRKYVLKLDDANVVTYQPVTLGEKVAGLRVVQSGLTTEDRIVVSGLQKIRPSMQVAPKVVEMATTEQLADIHRYQQWHTEDNSVEASGVLTARQSTDAQ
ncbi:efflux RND transporter periplasmic adaptor subunit [Photobacterium sp. WH77]|uniref:efflux RND transporter periplasmic adaptor subunit n=1 Tax=unclassified Photobacterium TaxID=2628852 RepID=UPI001EDB9AFC|nr:MULTISPECIES: efflux RND transporter periplasmic adaptor subunit [unclassified Photobacterium]MCG2836083.1 efflux RND transporter periplasmic adaptor subunit [Photobacterium sp. WH77]MCG2843780.1 efflux RND transporter periplasmic adaptor subunit [Photobacterium sp. WH80]